MSGKSAAKKGSGAPKTTLSEVSGVVFPVGRMHRYMRRHRVAARVGKGAAVYMAAVLEYISAELLEVGGYVAKDMKKTRVVPRDLMLAIRQDNELDSLFRGATLPFSGTLPFIHRKLLVDKKMKKEIQESIKADMEAQAERNRKSQAAADALRPPPIADSPEV